MPRKPWPFWNKYHTICCGLSGILFGLGVVEGEDWPKELVNPAYNKNGGATCGLLLRTERLIWVSGRALVLDLEFCILWVII